MKVKVCALKSIELVTTGKKLIIGTEVINPILPKYSHEDDACMDVYPIYCEYDSKKDRFIYHTGLSFALPISENGEFTELEMRPRSNLTKSDFYIPNAPGTLDFNYRGEFLIIIKNRTDARVVNCLDIIGRVINLREYTDRYYKLVEELQRSCFTPPYDCNGENRCCQIIIKGRPQIEWDPVESIEDLGDTTRGVNGFGSTGGFVK